jgi:xanthine phosphoribosyltransferase
MDLPTLVAARARVEGTLVMVDEFLNHRVEPDVMDAIGDRFAAIFESDDVDLVLTAEASGIPPALVTSLRLGVPMVYAKKYLGTGNRAAFVREVRSPTKDIEYRVEVARRVLPSGSRVVVIDDFLSRGRSAEALGEITLEAGCDLIGFGFVIEKSYEGGRQRLEQHDWRVESLVEVLEISDGRPVVR